MAALNPASVLATRGPLHNAGRLIRARLEAVFPPARFDHGWLSIAPGREEWKRVVRRVPFVGLTWLSATPDPKAGRVLRARGSFRVLLVNAHPDVAARFVGDSIGPGQFAMVQVAALALHGLTPEPVAATGAVDPGDAIEDVGALDVTEITALTSEDWLPDDRAVAALVVQTDFTMTDAHDLPALLRLRGGWSFDGAAIAVPGDQDLTGDA